MVLYDQIWSARYRWSAPNIILDACTMNIVVVCGRNYSGTFKVILIYQLFISHNYDWSISLIWHKMIQQWKETWRHHKLDLLMTILMGVKCKSTKSSVIKRKRVFHISQYMRYLTMWYVRPAKPQISLRICAVWSEPLLVAWVFYDC